MSLIPDANLTREPVAIVGIGCRFPGASDLETFWRILRSGQETICPYPGGRFSVIDEFYQEKGEGHHASQRGGFLRDIDLFDAEFFGISPREAILLDPQQRILMELAWEALEDAGLPVRSVAGTRTGVFVGQWTSDFEACVNDLGLDPQLYSTTGSGRYAASGRLAYHFDLRGPNLTLDTACSSALVALHMACQSLRAGESELALAGGVNVILRPEISLAYGSAGMLSPDGRCRFGDAGANGYVRSEAGGIVVLKLLRRALADRDPIHAVVRGSCVNSDGASSRLLVSPSTTAQASLIRSALQDAGVSASQIDYVEAHGTGTLAGDPVELEAIGTVLGEAPRQRPCLVGSVKTNIGHPEAAAGMAGLCKVVLAMQHSMVPATLNFSRPNPKIPWDRLPLLINREPQLWPHSGERKFAGVNSFGITGTNAHAIIENAPAKEPAKADPLRPRLYVLSARTQTGLEQAAASWRAWINDDSSWPSSAADLAYTAAVRRTHHASRLAVVAADPQELDARLASWLAGETEELVHCGKIPDSRPRVVFVFPGQGGQWAGMGAELLDSEPVFRAAIVQCDEALYRHTGRSVIDELRNPVPSEEIDRVQPSLFALTVSLAALWRSWGVEPEAVIGHSMGEAAAAVVCGALSLEDGAAVIAQRSRLIKALKGRGLMAMVALSFAEATEFVKAFEGRISIAANNSPSSTVLSGEIQTIEEALAVLESREVFCRRIRVDVASHCAQVDPILADLEQTLGSIKPRQARIPLYSTSTGRIEDGLSLDAAYWCRNVREPVLFSDSVQQLLRDGFQTFVEVNAHPLLVQAIEECARYAGAEVVALPSMRRDKPQLAEMLGSLGKLHVSDHAVRFEGLYSAGECLRLPAYPWQRESYWPEQTSAGGARFASRGQHPFLGGRVEASLEPGMHLWPVKFSPPVEKLEATGWCLDLVVAASRELFEGLLIGLEDVRFRTSVVAAEEGQLVIQRRPDGVHRFHLSAKRAGIWTTCCEGDVRGEAAGGAEVGRGGALAIERVGRNRLEALTECLTAAAEASGRTEGSTDWNSSRIERVECEAPREAGGTHTVRMQGAQFQVEGRPDRLKDVYQWTWAQIALPIPKEISPKKTSSGVVIVGGDGAPVELERYLALRGMDAIRVAHLDSVKSAIESAGENCQGVLWVLKDRTSMPEAALDQVHEVSLLLRELTDDAARTPRLWLATTGACRIQSAEAASASQAAIWGLARVIACEHPEVRCVSLDLSSMPDSSEAELLCELISNDAAEEQMAIRGTTCYGLRAERIPRGEAEAAIRKGCTYLITGGAGSLGLRLAAFLSEKGAQSITLAGRRPLGTEARQAIAAIESRGAAVRYVQADVAERQDVARILEEIEANGAPLKGIFHLAAVAQDALLANIDRESIHKVMRPKVFGAWNLHQLTLRHELDYFVTYSSVAAVSSQPGQGSYAASNAYLDGLALMRQANGLPALSIEWGPWKDSGMRRAAGASRSLIGWAEQGIGAFSKEAGLASLSALMGTSTAVAFVAAIDWSRFGVDATGKALPAYSGLVAQTSKTVQKKADVRERLAGLPELERNAELEAHLKSVVAAVLKSNPARIDSASRLGSIGVDSLMAAEIARRVTGSLGVRLPVTALFNFPTLKLLTKEVSRRFGFEAQPNLSGDAAAGEPAKLPAPAGAPTHSPAVEEMSEEEAVLSLVKAGGRT